MTQKSIFVALIGAPNAGKSTMTNKMVGTKVTIVSPKVQTTRASIRGIVMQDQTQIVLIDTPGIFIKPQRNLEQAIVKEAWNKLGEADVIALLIDAKKGICANTKSILESLKKQQRKAILLLNKVDLVAPEILLPLTKELNDLEIFTDIFMVSALNGDGIPDVLKYFDKIAPESPWMYDEDQASDAPLRFLAAEITREKLFLQLQQELPYNVAVETEKWEEDKKKIIINQCIYVAKNGQKKIVLGKGGSNIKRIGQMARGELQSMFDKKVSLFLFVKVKENWLDNPSLYQDIGLEFPGK